MKIPLDKSENLVHDINSEIEAKIQVFKKFIMREEKEMVDINFVWLHSVHEPDFTYYDSVHDWWLLVQTKSYAKIHLPDQDVIVPPDTALVFPPKMVASYEAYDGPYANYYVRFYTDEDFIEKLNIPFGKPIALRSPESMDHLFEVLSKEFFTDFSYSQQSMGMIMRLMVMKLAESIEDTSMTEQQRELINLRYDIQTRPDYQWTVGEMARRVHVSTGYLQSIYKKQFGVSCMQDVLNRRVDLAKEYLQSSAYSSQKIAQLCGYQSIEHFCRQFKMITGMSPLQYRKLLMIKAGKENDAE